MYIGLDPSFKHFGIAVIDETNKEIIYKEKQFVIGGKGFRDKFRTTNLIAFDATELILEYTKNNKVYLGQEISTAFQQGFWTRELYGVACQLFNLLSTLRLESYDLYSQAYLKYIHGKKNTKEDTIWFIEKEINPLFEKKGYKIIKEETQNTKTDIKVGARYVKEETITDGEADAMLYAIRQFVRFSKDAELVKQILEIKPRFSDKKEID